MSDNSAASGRLRHDRGGALVQKCLFYRAYLALLAFLCFVAGCVNNDTARMGMGYLMGGGAFQ